MLPKQPGSVEGARLQLLVLGRQRREQVGLQRSWTVVSLGHWPESQLYESLERQQLEVLLAESPELTKRQLPPVESLEVGLQMPLFQGRLCWVV